MTPMDSPREPAHPPLKPPEAPKPTDSVGGTLGCLFGLAILFLVTIFIIPHANPEKPELESTLDERAAMTKTLAASFPTAAIELKQLGGFNLEVWISKKEFESISYLDRKTLLETVGKPWCDKFGGWKCPTITVRDDKGGKELGAYHCLFSRSTIGDE
jgi:hypothetical protein